MRYQIGAPSITGAPFLDAILLGIVLGVLAQGVITALSGKMPGPGMLIAGAAGGLIGCIIFLFKSGLSL